MYHSFFIHSSVNGYLGCFHVLCCCCSVAQSYLTCLRPHGLQHTRLPCPSLSPWSLLRLMSIESMVPSNRLILCYPLLFLPWIFPSLSVFSNGLALCSGGQSIGASASVPPVDIQGWFPFGLTGLISLLSQGRSRVFSSTTICKHWLFGTQPSLWSNWENHSFDR